jgi:hypothetical protein
MNPLESTDGTKPVAPLIPCEGRWEQVVFGRQSMRQLGLSIDGGTIRGAGIETENCAAE